MEILRDYKVHILALLIVLVCELIGKQTLWVITVYPMLYAMIIGEILNAKLALIFQEIGHFAGTILLGLPLAVMLGMGREAVGATYSVAREPNIAIVADKYGLDSPEGRGVMAMYVCGTL